MIAILRDNPLLLLFLVAGIGYPLGRIKIAESSLGVAAVLFVGLAFGALDPSLKLPEVIYQLGLAIFVYTIGLGSGPAFFASLRGKGLRDNLYAVAMVTLSAGLTVGAHYLLRLRAAQTAGLFVGSMTSTPALAAAVEYLKHYTQGPVNLSDPVVGYSIAYPVSVLGMITTIYLVQRWWKIDYAAEARKMRGVLGMAEPINNVTVRVTNARAVGRTVPDLVSSHGWKVIFGRIERGEGYAVAGGQTRLQADDLITVVGTPEELARVTSALGEMALEEADLDRHDVDMRRMFISSPRVAGRRLRDLQLPQRFGAVVTRVRRGDSELLPTADMVLELGDRVRVLCRREHLAEVAGYLGDSYRALSQLDISTFSFGLALGIFLGLVPIPLPGGITIKLGLAGGPMIVALTLSALNRTGPIVWGLPYSANLMLRQLGLILFLAAVGTRSGYEFGQTLLQGQGFTLLGAALVVVVVTGLVALWLGYKVLKIPFGFLVGLLAGTQTQAATLGFCLEQSHDELPNVGYAEVYAASMIVKIIIVQLIFTFLM